MTKRKAHTRLVGARKIRRRDISCDVATEQMFIAAMRDHPDWGIVEYWIRAGAKVNARCNIEPYVGCTILTIICKELKPQDNPSILSLLFTRQVDIDKPVSNIKCDWHGITPLLMAALQGNRPLMYKLREQGADFNTVLISPSHYAGVSFLWVLSAFQHLWHGATQEQWPYIQEIINLGAEVYHAPTNENFMNYRRSILSFAVLDLQIEFALKLLQTFDPKKFPDNFDYLLFELTHYKPVSTRDRKIIELINILLIGRNITALRDPHGHTILDYAVFNGNEILVDMLLTQWPQLIACRNEKGENALFHIDESAISGQVESLVSVLVRIVQRLQKAGLSTNELDKTGNSCMFNSALRGRLVAVECWLKFNVQYIHRGKESKSKLHLLIGIMSKGDCILNLIEFSDMFNVVDEELRTPLHHAIILRRDEMAVELVKAGAKVTLQDKYGRSAFHYALMLGMQDVVSEIFKDKDQLTNGMRQQDCFGNTCLTFACYSSNVTIITQVSSIACFRHSFVDRLIMQHIDFASFKIDPQIFDAIRMHGSASEKLIVLGVLSSLVKDTSYSARKISAFVKQHILPPHKTKSRCKKFPPGRRFGLELEIANMPEVSIVPTNILLDWFAMRNTYDGSVVHSLLMRQDLQNTELVSNVLSQAQGLNGLEGFMLGAEYLRKSGALVNFSTGFHIHVNINGGGDIGYITDSMDLHVYDRTFVMLKCIKQILLNWSMIEEILRGFLRSGNYFDDFAAEGSYGSYLAITPHIDKLLECANIEEMQDIYNNRNCYPSTVSVLSLKSSKGTTRDQHGTIEFRMHDGTTDAVLIAAWFNLIYRLIDISVTQIQEMINNETLYKSLRPYTNIEQLVYVLIAERRYQETWDADRGSARDYYQRGSEGDHQKQIQIAPLYIMYQKIRVGEYINSSRDATLQQELQRMLDISAAFPGVQQPTI